MIARSAMTSSREGGDWLASLLAKAPDDLVVLGLRAALILVLGVVLGRLLGSVAGRLAARHGSAQSQMLARRFVFYAVIALAGLMVLDTLGVQIGVLLGAAGILTVALGFASQTSASNLISGLFLLGERPFSVGDVIQVGDRVGVVLSVDLLSVKLRTFDNLFVRVPNETLIKSEIVNFSRHPIRRIEVELRLGYAVDFEQVETILRSLAREDPDVLEEPEPVVWLDRLGDSAIHARFLVWAGNRPGLFFDVRSRVHASVVRALAEHRITVGYPKITIEGDASATAAAAERTSEPPSEPPRTP
jgi:small-conductance mechanosensitive channel